MVNIQLNVPRPDVNLELKAGRDVPPVTSVNGKTGVVVLDAEDVDAVPYEEFRSPLQKILDVTLEEDSALVVTEIDGEPLSAEELYLALEAPTGIAIPASNNNTYCGTKNICRGYHGARAVNATGKFWFWHCHKIGGLWISDCVSSMTGNNFAQVYRYFQTFGNGFPLVSSIDYPKITKVECVEYPAGTRIALYAR